MIKVDGETKLTLMKNYPKDFTTAKLNLYDKYTPYAKLSSLKIKLLEKQQGNSKHFYLGKVFHILEKEVFTT